jgi:hypothetical protein
MIANLIPGLRDIRAGLAAGYLWLAAIWLLVYDNVPTTSNEATGLWESIFQLEGAASALGIGVVLSFGAYLLGTASQAALDPIIRFGVKSLLGGRVVDLESAEPYFKRPRRYGVLGPILSEQSRRSLDLIALEAISRAESIAKANINNILKRPYAWSDEVEADAQGMSLDQFLSTRQQREDQEFREWFNDLVPSLSLTDRGTLFYGGLAPGSLMSRLLDRLSWAAAALLPVFRPVDDRLPHMDLVEQLSIGLSLELTLVKNRLLSEDVEQFNFVDRIESESDLRFAIIAPLVAVTTILTVSASAWWAIGFVGIGLLLFQAVGYDRRVQSTVVDRLLVGDVVAPIIERLQRYANEGRPLRDGVDEGDVKLRSTKLRERDGLDGRALQHDGDDGDVKPRGTRARERDALGGKLAPYYPVNASDPYSGHVSR